MTQGKFANLKEAERETFALLRRADKRSFLRRYRSDKVSHAYKLMDANLSPLHFINGEHVDKLVREKCLELQQRKEPSDYDYVTIG